MNLVLAWAEDGKEIVVDVPLVFKGEDVCSGIQNGGYLHSVRKSLIYLCPAEHIPPKIEVDINNLDIGDKLKIDDIKVHPSMKLISKNKVMPLCNIMAAKIQDSENATLGGACFLGDKLSNCCNLCRQRFKFVECLQVWKEHFLNSSASSCGLLPYRLFGRATLRTISGNRNIGGTCLGLLDMEEF